MRRILAVIALTSTLACGEEPPDLNGDGAGGAEGTVTQIGLVHPQGTIAGHVYNAATGENLTGITVTIISGAQLSPGGGKYGRRLPFRRFTCGGMVISLSAVVTSSQRSEASACQERLETFRPPMPMPGWE